MSGSYDAGFGVKEQSCYIAGFVIVSYLDGIICDLFFFFFFSSRRRHTIFDCDWSSDVCSSDLLNRLPRLGPRRGSRFKCRPGCSGHRRSHLAIPAECRASCGWLRPQGNLVTLEKGGASAATGRHAMKYEVRISGKTRIVEFARNGDGWQRSEERRVGKECRSRW